VEFIICNVVKQVLAAAKNGFVADGVELNPWLVAYSKLQAFRLGLSSCARFYCQDLWKVRLQPYHNVVVFGVQEMVSVGSETFCLYRRLLVLVVRCSACSFLAHLGQTSLDCVEQN